MKRFALILICSFFASCKTYEKATVKTHWIDKWNYKHTVWETRKYLRKNDSLISVRIDTMITDLSPPNNSFIIPMNHSF